MRVPTRVGYALGVAAAVALFAGCSGSGSSLSPIAQAPGGSAGQSVVRINHVPTILPGQFLKGFQPGSTAPIRPFASPDFTGALVYACGYYNNQCVWYHVGRNKVAGSLPNLTNPQGLGVDIAGNVYIGNTGASNIPVFAKGSTTLVKTLDDSGQYPVDVAVAPDGTVFVANIFDTSFNPGSVSVYAPGSLTVSRRLTDPNFYQVISVALDEHKNLVVCYNNSSGVGACDQFLHGRGHGVNKITGIGFAGGDAFDATENFVADDQLGPTTNEYTAAFASCNKITQSGDPLFLAFDHSSTDLYVANAGNANITESTYTTCSATSTLEFTYSAGWTGSTPPFGVAVDAGLRP